MLNHIAIDDLQAPPLSPDRAAQIPGYGVNIRPSLMADDLKPFVVTPRAPFRRWHDDQPRPPLVMREDRPDAIDVTASMNAHEGWRPSYSTIFLIFPDEAAARASSLGQYWVDA